MLRRVRDDPEVVEVFAVTGSASASDILEHGPKAATSASGHEHARVAGMESGGAMIPRRALACEDIHIELGGRPILEGVSLSVAPGEVLGVVGPNGAGKTTLFEVLSGR